MTGLAGGGLATLFDQISQLVSQTVSADQAAGRSTRTDDRYVTGGVNWNGYGLKPLIRMVADQSSPAQVDAVAGLWRDHGAAITQGAQDLQSALATLMQYWQGTASAQANTSVTQNTQWVSSLGDVATSMASPIEDASGALRSAQSTMPGSPQGGFFAGFSGAAGGAAIGAAFGGPFGAAAGAVIGGIASAFGFGSSEKKLKRQAVQTMQRYEQAAMNIDTGTPGFTGPAAGITGDQGGSGTGSTGGGSGVGHIPTGSTTPSSTDPLNTTTPSFATDPIGRWGGLTGGAGGPGSNFGLGGNGTGSNGFGAFGAGGMGAGLGAGGLGGMGAGGMGRGRLSRLGSSAADEEEGRNNSIFGDNEEELAGRGSATGANGAFGEGEEGMPMGAGAGGRGRRGEDDREYKRHIPFEEDPFTTNMKVVPPVIGLRHQDKGD